jgi:hypothetical protein
MRGRRRLRAASILLAAITAGATWVPSGSAVAHDHRIPRVKVISAKARQRGRLQSFCWVTGHQGSNTACAGGAYTWPEEDGTPGGKRALLRIHKIQRPRRLKITRWRRVDDQNAPIGEGREVRYNLSTELHRGEVVQEARFHLPRRRGHYYLRVFGMWRDVVSNEKQNATWSFHLKLR